MAVEYPGYGLYKNKNPNENQILEDSESVVDYAMNTLGFDHKKIIVFGRSIGSGPAVHLAAKLQLGGLFLLTPFKSIKGAVRNMLGKVAEFFVKQRFDNLSKIVHCKCPIGIVHGDSDPMIPLEHSEELKGKF